MNQRHHQQQQTPPERKPKHGTEISDLRYENMTEADAREDLSTYIIIRMDKSQNANERDRAGKLVVPSWDRVTRTEEIDISQEEATRKVRELNKKTDTAINKKNEMPANVQRQIERARDVLESGDPDSRYEYELSQLESRILEIDEKSPLYKIHVSKDKDKKDKDKDKDKKDKDKKDKDKKDKDKDKDKDKYRKFKDGKEYRDEKGKKDKGKYERVSVTAYFRRVPKRNLDAMAMLQQILKSKGQSSVPRQVHNPQQQQMGHMGEGNVANIGQRLQQLQNLQHMQQMNPAAAGMPRQIHQQQQPQPQYAQQPQPQPQPQYAQPQPQPQPAPMRQPQIPPFNLPMRQRQPPPNITTVPDNHHHRSITPNHDIRTAGGRTPRIYKESPRSPRSSHGSFSSSDPWDSSDDVEYVTPESSIGSSSRYYRKRYSSKHRHRRPDRPEQFGLDLPSGRHHNKRDKNYIPPPSPPSTAASPRLIERELDAALQHAYDKGRVDTYETLVQRPVVVQPTSPAPRLITAYDARRAMADERLDEMETIMARVNADDDIRRDRAYVRDRDYHYNVRDDGIERGRRLESRLHRRDPLDGLEYDEDLSDLKWGTSRATNYMRTRERGDRLNPMAPVGRYYRS